MLHYKKEKEMILEEFSVDPTTGLSQKQVLNQRELYGENKLPEEAEDPYWKVFLKNFKEPIVIVLLGAVVLSFLSSYYAFNIQNDPKHGVEALEQIGENRMVGVISHVDEMKERIGQQIWIKKLGNGQSTLAVQELK